MEQIIIQSIKYLTIFLLAFDTFLTFRVVIMKPGKGKTFRLKFMTFLMYSIHFFNFMALYLAYQEMKYLMLYAAQVIIFALFGILYKKCYKQMSYPVFQTMQTLIMLGFVMITRLDFENGVKQFIIASASLLLCFVVPLVIDRIKMVGKLSYLYGIAGLAVLIIVLFFGTTLYGAKNWLQVGNILFQPSEFVKILFIFFVASVFHKVHDFKRIVFVTVLAAAHVLVLVLEKDLGGALIFYLTYIVMLYAATGKLFYLLSGIGAGALASAAAYSLFAHVRVRVEVFKNPFATINGTGYQSAQSLFAIGTGGFSGMGLTLGLPDTIPVADSDFIFSAISEEMGGIVGICILFLCLSCFILFINISMKFTEPFYKITALGISTMYITQVILNIGGAIKAIPSTGVTLPLVSYGGSSIASSILMFSIIQGMYVLHMRKEETGQKNKATQRTILSMTYIFSLMIFGIAGYYCYFIGVTGKTIINNSYNPRQDLLAKHVIRGQIVSSDGKILAQTIEDADGNDVRLYPYDNVFAHAIGRVDHGKTGLEQAESFTLLTCSENALDQIFTTMAGKKNQGDTVVATINAKLQQAAYDALGNHKGAVVVLEPSTGKILAMVSKPDYDPNTINDKWDSLNSDAGSPLLNRATQGLYAPGSTFKLLTTLEFIRENPDYQDYEFDCTGEINVLGADIHCAGNAAHGKETLEDSFINSCNASFANIGSMLDPDAFHAMTETMLFNTSLPLSIKTLKSTFTLTSASDPEDIPRTAIGLAKTQVTPMHNAMIAASVANGGVLMVPYLKDSVMTVSGTLIDTTSPKEYGPLMTKEEANLLTDYMTKVVEEGTASKLKGMKVSVAGKTGTATYDNNKDPHAWFIGFAPAEDPCIAISVIVESSGTGSKYAVPVAKKLIEVYFDD